ncbi:MAG: caspase family protein [Synergistaceae bacterium]|jgi:hypothetical protein|nr:caspase family protein [Synergistaceae bacterium]
MSFKKFALCFLHVLCGVVFLVVDSAQCAETGRKYALLIGINAYNGGDFTSLQGCHNDVQLVRNLLSQPRFGFASDDITVLLDEQATHNAILGAMSALAEKTGRNDIVYVHYSGHGSTTPDLNGDEAQETGQDSTLVSYGARSAAQGVGNERSSASSGLDDYDLLDDELEWALAKIAGKTQNLVFVADACHSGTITRGNGEMATRGAAADARAHPAGSVAPLADRPAWVGVGAAQVTEKAVEYLGDDNQKYGAFTWFWVRALQSAAGGDTWQMVFERAKALMRNAQIPQNPSLEGDVSLKIFGGRVKAIPKKFTITRAYPSVQVNVGTFAGISEKSEFQVENKGMLTGVRLVVERAEPYVCEVSVEGGVARVGDVAVLTKWMPSFSSMKVALRAYFQTDEPLLDDLRRIFVESEDVLAAYEVVDSPDQSGMVLWVTRPMRDGGGNFLMEENSGLPQCAETAAPQVWVMDPSQSYLYNRQEALKIEWDEKGREVLARNLERLARLYGLYNMPFPEGDGDAVAIEYKIFAPALSGEWGALSEEQRLELTHAPQGVPRRWKLSRIVSANDVGLERRPEERLLSIRVENRSDRPYHIYGVNATPDAMILPFLPAEQGTLTEVKPGQIRDFKDHLTLTDEDEYIRVFATLKPINIHILAQQAIETHRKEKRGAKNPVEGMFMEQLYRTREATASSGFTPAELSSKGTRFSKSGK